MNRFENYTRPLMWLMALLIATLAAGCGSDSGNSTSSSAKAITAYSLAWTTGTPGSATGIIDQTLKTINVTVPYGTNVNPLFATFTTTGASVTVGSVTQVNGTTANDFSVPVAYKVTAADGTWATYTVIVTVSTSTAKAITTFTLAASGVPSIGTVITEGTTPKTIVVTLPYGTTDLTALVATFTTTGSSVTVGGTPQTTGVTPNDFSAASGVAPVPVAYVVTAADASTATYNVTVNVALSSSKEITAFSLAAASGVPASTATVISGTASPYDIAVTMPYGTTDLTALVATFTTTGDIVKVGSAPAVTQVSGTTPNDFTGSDITPVEYRVIAVDGSVARYNVAVNVAAAASTTCTGGASCVPLGGADNFTILAETMITGTGNSITGNIGVSPAAGSTITVPCTDMLTGKVYQVDDTYADTACSMSGTISGGANKTIVDTAVADMGTAYTDAAGRTVPAATTELGTGNISGMTLTPGIYKWSTGVLIYAGNPNAVPGGDATGVTLDCAGGTGGGSNAVFVFQIATPQALTLGQAGTPASINLTGGCQASNIFWQVGGDVTITPASVFNGNILTATQVVMQAGAVLHGRALAQTAVTLIQNTVGP